MPQPDNRRAQGKAAGRYGNQVGPEGTSGVYTGTVGSTAGTAGAQVQIGQQAQIIKTGAELYQSLEGLAKGIEGGIAQFERWEEKIAKSEYNTFQSELTEYSRSVQGDPKRTAEWARAQSYRPNRVVAREYNQTMASMEGLEYDSYQDDLLAKISKEASVMPIDKATEHMSSAMSQLHPTDKAYKALAESVNTNNSKMTAIASSNQQLLISQEQNTGIFDLGAALLATNKVTPGDLRGERANMVATAVAFYGSDTDKLKILQDGTISYTNNQGEVIQGSFQGGLNESLINNIRRDLGEAAGSMEDGTFNPTVAQTIQTAMRNGKFNGMHTAQRAGAELNAPNPGELALSMSIPGTTEADRRGQFAMQVAASGLTPEKMSKRVSKLVGDTASRLSRGGENGDMPYQARIDGLNNLILTLGEDADPKFWESIGLDPDNKPEEVFKAIDDARNALVDVHIDFTAASDAQGAIMQDNATSASSFVHAAAQRRLGTLNSAQGIGSNVKIHTVNSRTGNRQTFLTMGDATDYFNTNMGDIPGSIIQIEDSKFAKATRLGPGVFIGPAGAAPPANMYDNIKKEREMHARLIQADQVRAAVVDARNNPSAPMVVSGAEATSAVATLAGKLPAQPLPSELARTGIFDILTSRGFKPGEADAMLTELRDPDVAKSVADSLDMSEEEIRTPLGELNEEQKIKRGLLASLLGSPQTAEYGRTMLGSDEDAWFVVDAGRWSAEYEAAYGRPPTGETLAVAATYSSYTKAFRSEALDTVEGFKNVFSAPDSTEALNFRAAVTDGVGATPQTKMFIKLADKWNNTPGLEEANLMDVLSNPSSEYYGSAVMFMDRAVNRMTSARGMNEVLLTDNIKTQLQLDRNNAAKSGNARNSPSMNDVLVGQMWDKAISTVVLPATGVTMTVKQADVGTVPNDAQESYGNANMTVAQQGSVQLTRFVTDVVESEFFRDNKTLKGGDSATVFREMGIDMTGNGKVDTVLIEGLKTSPQDAVRKVEAELGPGSEAIALGYVNRFMDQISELFPARPYLSGNLDSGDTSAPQFMVGLGNTDSIENPLLREILTVTGRSEAGLTFTRKNTSADGLEATNVISGEGAMPSLDEALSTERKAEVAAHHAGRLEKQRKISRASELAVAEKDDGVRDWLNGLFADWVPGYSNK